VFLNQNVNILSCFFYICVNKTSDLYNSLIYIRTLLIFYCSNINNTLNCKYFYLFIYCFLYNLKQKIAFSKTLYCDRTTLNYLLCTKILYNLN